MPPTRSEGPEARHLEPRSGLFPARIGHKLERAFERMEAQALVTKRADQLHIERAVETTERGMVGIAKISLREAALIRVVPHAESRLRAAADSGSAVVLGRIFEAGL